MSFKGLIFKSTLSCVLMAGCATSPTPKTAEPRHPSSLDNNGESRDDGFDANLESYFGGSATKEAEANIAVAEVIRQSVAAQQKGREEMAQAHSNTSTAQRVFKDLPKPAYATRDVHRKTNGCYQAQLTVRDNIKTRLNEQMTADATLPNHDPRVSLIQNDSDLGVFAPGATYDAIVRISNGHPGNRPDRQPDARGFAVKLLPQGSLNQPLISKMDATSLNKDTVLDILSINFPTFFMNDPVRYANLNKLALSSALDFKNKAVGKVQEFWSVFVSGDLSAMERRLTLFVNGSVIYSPLYQEYFSMVPSRLGPEGTVRAVKYSWVPVSCRKDVVGSFVEDSDRQWPDWAKDHSFQFPPRSPKEVKNFPDDYLRVHTRETLAKQQFCFDLFFQVYNDTLSTNIEDSTDPWLRTELERKWWMNIVTPGLAVWETSSHNTIGRRKYLERIKKKSLAVPTHVARLTINKFNNEERAEAAVNNKTCEDLSFNPWNGNIAYHKPLGVVSRMKRKVYNASRRERHELNGINDKHIERP